MTKSSDLKIIVFGNSGFAAEIIEQIFSHNKNLVAVVCKRPSWSFIKWYHFIFKTAYKIFRRNSYKFVYRETFDPWKSSYSFAKTHKIPILDSRKIQSPVFEAQLKKYQPDVIFVAGFHRIIPKSLLGVPTEAIINLHPSLLPKNRGGTPIRWAKVRGDKNYGVTAHLVTEEVDGGNIVQQKKIQVSSSDTAGDIERKMASAAAEMSNFIAENLKKVLKNQQKQSKKNVSYDPPLHGKYQSIKWDQSGERIKNLIDAMKPKSGGIFKHKNKHLCIYNAKFFKTKKYKTPGTILKYKDNDGIYVQCRNGILKILSLLENGKIIPVRSFLKKIKIRNGDILK